MAKTRILPAETIECEILPRLPVKSLLRFKSVCKSWYSLIPSDVFIKSFRNSDSDSLTLISVSEEYPTRIIGCINGLVFTENSDEDRGRLGFTVQNPATRQRLKIASPPEDGVYVSGFGFDSVTSDYKLMQFTITDEGTLVGYIYSCNAGCWSEITQSNFVVPHNICNAVPAALVNGSPFWLKKEYYDVNKTRLTVMLFDVRQEVFRLLPDLSITNNNKRHEKIYTLLNFRDSVAVMSYSFGLWFGDTIDIHIFNEKRDDWIKTSFGPFKVLSRVPSSKKVPLFLHCLSNGDILFVEGNILYWVDLQKYTIKSLEKGSDGLCYSESLVFIKGMKPFHEKKDRYKFFFLKKDHVALREEMNMKKYVEARKKIAMKSSKRNRHDDEEKYKK